MFKGLRTVIYNVDDIDAAKKWYAELFSTQPYYDQPYYVGFNIGGFELGLDPDMSGVERGNNAVGYWGVADARSAFDRAVTLGGKSVSEPRDVGEGILVATVADPFGNVIGIIENPHFSYSEG